MISGLGALQTIAALMAPGEPARREATPISPRSGVRQSRSGSPLATIQPKAICSRSPSATKTSPARGRGARPQGGGEGLQAKPKLAQNLKTNHNAGRRVFPKWSRMRQDLPLDPSMNSGHTGGDGDRRSAKEGAESPRSQVGGEGHPQACSPSNIVPWRPGRR